MAEPDRFELPALVLVRVAAGRDKVPAHRARPVHGVGLVPDLPRPRLSAAITGLGGAHRRAAAVRRLLFAGVRFGQARRLKADRSTGSRPGCGSGLWQRKLRFCS